LATHLAGEFESLRGATPDEGGDTIQRMIAWEKHMGTHGWHCLGWPKEHGGKDLSLVQQVIFNEEYARADGPWRLGHIAEQLLGPTIMDFGTEEQKARFLPPIVRGDVIWCQGYSEPAAGSDLANVKTKAVRDGDDWVITGQKVWTSLAQWAEWGFFICRTNPERPRHKGLSYILVPMDQPGIEIRPIVQMTGHSEFSEVFLDGARAKVADTIGPIDGGWPVAMGTLAIERGVSTLGQQLQFQIEFDAIVQLAKENGRSADPEIRQRLSQSWIELKIMRLNSLRILSGITTAELGREAMITKLYWASWHQRLGELAMAVAGPASIVSADSGPLAKLQRLFQFSRSETIYAGSNQIQRNIIGERALGLPREPRPERSS
jgi:alkylation response protein AidB-like acyl-CoA dehydrogenase